MLLPLVAVSSTSVSEDNNHPPINVIDNDPTTYW